MPTPLEASVKQGESTPADFRDLAERIRKGDASAFDALVGELWAQLVRYAARFFGSAEDAQDIAQEAFVRLWEQRARLDPAHSIRAYLYQIARNLAINETRRRETFGRIAARQVEPAPRSPTPATDLDEAELRAVVRDAIDALSPRRREAFVLAHLQGLAYKEAAEVMEISPQTVANQISAALADLRGTLAPYLGEHGRESRRQSG